MGESVASGAALEVSVSFGRFESDSLSWEKWSSFSPNKHLEEVEKFSTPGSVAKKKAFFEAHYKKIAARKAELLLEQEKQEETNPLNSDFPSCSDDSEKTCGVSAESFGMSEGQKSPKEFDRDTSVISLEETSLLNSDFSSCRDDSGNPRGTAAESVGISDCQSSPNEVDQNNNVPSFQNNSKFGAVTEFSLPISQDSSQGVEQDTNRISIINNTHVEDSTKSAMPSGQGSLEVLEQDTDSTIALGKSDEDAVTAIQSQTVVTEGAAGETDGILDNFEANKPEKAVLMQGDTHIKESRDVVKPPPDLDEERGGSPVNKDQDVRLNPLIKSQKSNPMKKEKNLGAVKKKLASPPPKSPKFYTPPRLSKPTAASMVTSSSQSSTKKSSSSALPRINRSAGESKRVAPISLHMSLSLGSGTCDSTSQMIPRKSIIMEKMGDKDIVKRAFKTFQSNVNQLRPSNDEISSGKKQVLTKGTEKKLSTSWTPRKENDGTRKFADKINTKTTQSGTRPNSMSSGSYKQVGENQRTAKAAPSSFGLRSNVRADKWKEKLEEKSSATEAEPARHSSKSKEDKDAEIRKIRQNSNFKATPMPGFYRGQGISKNPLYKEGVRRENHGRGPETHM